jgi:cobalamin biosynthesis protein CbiG
MWRRILVARHGSLMRRRWKLKRRVSKNPSDIVFAEVGCHGVAEGAALAAVGHAMES